MIWDSLAKSFGLQITAEEFDQLENEEQQADILQAVAESKHDVYLKGYIQEKYRPEIKWSIQKLIRHESVGNDADDDDGTDDDNQEENTDIVEKNDNIKSSSGALDVDSNDEQDKAEDNNEDNDDASSSF